MSRSLEQVIEVVQGWQIRRDTGEGVFIGDADIIDELLDFLKEAKGLRTYQLQLSHDIGLIATRHRKFTREAAIAVAAGDKVLPVDVSLRLDVVGPDATGPTGKLSLTETYVNERHGSGYAK